VPVHVSAPLTPRKCCVVWPCSMLAADLGAGCKACTADVSGYYPPPRSLPPIPRSWQPEHHPVQHKHTTALGPVAPLNPAIVPLYAPNSIPTHSIPSPSLYPKPLTLSQAPHSIPSPSLYPKPFTLSQAPHSIPSPSLYLKPLTLSQAPHSISSPSHPHHDLAEVPLHIPKCRLGPFSRPDLAPHPTLLGRKAAHKPNQSTEEHPV